MQKLNDIVCIKKDKAEIIKMPMRARRKRSKLVSTKDKANVV